MKLATIGLVIMLAGAIATIYGAPDIGSVAILGGGALTVWALVK